LRLRSLAACGFILFTGKRKGADFCLANNTPGVKREKPWEQINGHVSLSLRPTRRNVYLKFVIRTKEVFRLLRVMANLLPSRERA
jgi:hypothetical protein